ncbi:hypothetical protein SHVI106290_08410 [Shewanella violacea]|uniref:Uncharacterized protein n=2 Tax=Shewanella violacea TaxID=60217 RepID=D4ZKJ1_SHEVD|nr:hypothetical protein SVI_2219 [Shewanella violacea DSS12]
MFDMKSSTQILQSKLTLVLLLVVFLSQLFPTCVASDIHYNGQSTAAVSSQPIEQQESCCHLPGHACSHTRVASESSDQDGDFHSSCHPPIEHSFVSDFNRVQGASLFLVSYQNRSYAPPIPPPHA